MKAELDYALLADYADVNGEKLTVVGGSFTKVVFPSFPAQMMAYVAGRLRVFLPDTSVEIRIKVIPPNEDYDLEIVGQLQMTDDVVPYTDNKAGALFAIGLPLSLPSVGLYTVEIRLADELVRTLRFEAIEA